MEPIEKTFLMRVLEMCPAHTDALPLVINDVEIVVAQTGLKNSFRSTITLVQSLQDTCRSTRSRLEKHRKPCS